MKLHPTDSTDWIELSNWCQKYLRHNKYPVDVVYRYGIAVYQVHQGMEWTDPLNKAESFMSAFLHLQMVDEHLKLGTWVWSDYQLTLINTWPPNWERLFYLVSKVQQQVFYFTRAGKTKRATRYNPKLTCELLAELQIKLVAMVPSYLRTEGIYHATKIMTSGL
jgi:hypothetical protein